MERPPLAEKLACVFEIGDHRLEPVSRRPVDASGFRLEQLEFRNVQGEGVRAFFARPQKREAEKAGGSGGRDPAILYIHAHGNRHDIGCDELIAGRPALQGPLGPVLAEAGYAVLAIDLPCFGRRAEQAESAAAKAALWYGRSLAAQMVGELASALDWLEGEEGVDGGRLGVFGLSMGATLAYWLAAVDRRLKSVVHLCCYADFATLIESGVHDMHGPYLTVPGLLSFTGNGEIAGLVAPRPQLICIGDQDPLTPPQAVDRALAATRAAYEIAPEALVVHREAETGHRESAAMRQAVMAFFARTLLAA